MPVLDISTWGKALSRAFFPGSFLSGGLTNLDRSDRAEALRETDLYRSKNLLGPVPLPKTNLEAKSQFFTPFCSIAVQHGQIGLVYRAGLR
jgi:hypothetical protein